MAIDDTIAAIASGNQPSARGVVRISGPNAVSSLARFFLPGSRDVESKHDFSASNYPKSNADPRPKKKRLYMQIAKQLRIARKLDYSDSKADCDQRKIVA